MRPSAPFVLLDDARPGGAPPRLYQQPVAVLEARETQEVEGVLAQLREGTRAGLHAAGFLSYEAGAAFEPKAGRSPPMPTPLVWFGLFEGYEEPDLAALLPDPAGAWTLPAAPLIGRADYKAGVEQVLELIRAGDLYQANLSFRSAVAVEGDPLAIYARLRGRAGAGYGAVAAMGKDVVLSFSPELFFALEGDRLTCRPMKGTSPRGASPAEDRALRDGLAADAKNRAENLMIVDLMRNDLSRVAAPGSVETPELFAVETYPTVHQMVSTVTARLAPGRDAVDVLAAAFPCGSITGAPKVRAMQAIADLERGPRGPYTGAIGYVEPGGDAMFNVAIRTLVLQDAFEGSGGAVLSLGAGIVADSDPAAEWEECLAKGAFLGDGRPGFDLIETMAFDPMEGMALLERHLARMKASADRFGFTFDRHAARNELQAATFRLREARRVRLMLGPSGAVAVEVSPPPSTPTGPLRVAIVPLPVPAADLRLRHKTSERRFYDEARRAAGTDEVVFEHDGLLTEGSFTSVFVERDGVLLTPTAGPLLPGVLRAELLESGRAREAALTRDDLAGGFLLGNALRGLMPAVLA